MRERSTRRVPPVRASRRCPILSPGTGMPHGHGPGRHRGDLDQRQCCGQHACHSNDRAAARCRARVSPMASRSFSRRPDHIASQNAVPTTLFVVTAICGAALTVELTSADTPKQVQRVRIRQPQQLNRGFRGCPRMSADVNGDNTRIMPGGHRNPVCGLREQFPQSLSATIAFLNPRKSAIQLFAVMLFIISAIPVACAHRK